MRPIQQLLRGQTDEQHFRLPAQANWRHLQRPQVAAEPQPSPAQRSSARAAEPTALEMRREASIALERQGIHAERAGRHHDPRTTAGRIRDVELDPEVRCHLRFAWMLEH